jgi:hypothetical protein
MSIRLLIMVWALLFFSAPVYSQSAPPANPENCRAWADYAMNQQNVNATRNCGLTGAQWHSDWQGHYDWCMATPPAERQAMSKLKADVIAQCVAGAETPATCRAWADYALNQQKLNVTLRCGLTGAQWHVDWQRHYGWCMATPTAERKAMSKLKADALATCQAAPPPPPPPPPSGPAYLGCFKDATARDLDGRMLNRDNMTPALCFSYCREEGYTFAGLQYGRQCYCGQNFGRYGKAPNEDCALPCAGNPAQRCGGFWRNAVYELR